MMTAEQMTAVSRGRTLDRFTVPEERVHVPGGGLSRIDIDRACAAGRREAGRFTGWAPADLAVFLGVVLTDAAWSAGSPALILFAETEIRSRRVTLNEAAIDEAALSLRELPQAGPWRERSRIRTVVLAHELYHVASRRSGRRSAEIEAHAFARQLTGMPFSPLLYEWAVRSTRALDPKQYPRAAAAAKG